MSASQLLADLVRLGIRIEAHEDRLRYSPRSSVTPDLEARIRAHKRELLEMLKRNPSSKEFDPTDANDAWQALVDRLQEDTRFPPTILEGLRLAEARWVNEISRRELPSSRPVKEG
ncbi:MAG: hypothetical protein KDA80_17820 [Planctomycetaceae bacterium]|nr:hypothetical protein [Planctomycetaceae bacterium]